MDPAARFTDLVNRPASEAHLDLMAALIGASFDVGADVGSVIVVGDDQSDTHPGRCDDHDRNRRDPARSMPGR